MPGRKVSRKLNFSFILLSYQGLVLPLARYKQKPEEQGNKVVSTFAGTKQELRRVAGISGGANTDHPVHPGRTV